MGTDLPGPSEKEKLRFRFSLKTLFLVMTSCAVVLGLGVNSIPLVLAAWVLPRLSDGGYTGLIGVVIAALMFLPLFGVGVSVSVRLDTGDQRQHCWGIPFAFDPMREPARSSLLKVNAPHAPRGWRWCAQEVGSNNADLMVYSFYADASAWVAIDPEIAGLVVTDIAVYVDTTHATSGYPECITMLFPDVVERRGGNARVLDGWRTNPEVLAYLAKKGYKLNPEREKVPGTGSKRHNAPHSSGAFPLTRFAVQSQAR